MNRPRRSAIYSNRCPRCSAGHGQPCRDAQGTVLGGPHFERNRDRRRQIALAFDLYRPLTQRATRG